MKIRELYPDERPREKMLSRGAGSLSNAELLAILLRTGTGDMNVIDVARHLLGTADGSLVRLSSMSVEQMTGVKGIGSSKAVSVASAFELGRRFAVESVPGGRVRVTDASIIYRMMIPTMKGLAHEECWAVFLNRANYVIAKEKMSQGGSTATIIDTKAILRRALELKAEALILVHNHPSGSAYPGDCDIRETESLKKALKQLEVSLLDHVVVCDDSFFSFADNELTFANQ